MKDNEKKNIAKITYEI